MRFTAATLLFAGAVMANSDKKSTTTSTELVTVTSCAPSVTDCPSHSTVTSSKLWTTSTITSTDIVTVTKCPETVPHCPANQQTTYVTTSVYTTETVCPYTSTTSKYHNGTTPVTKPTTTYSHPPKTTPTLTTTSKEAPVCPTYSVKTISTSVTTVVPTVIYETVSIPCPTYTKPSATVPTGNGTVPVKPTSPVQAGAANLAFSGLFAAAAGLAAVALA